MWSYFTDPVLRAPTIGCMLMCMAASLVGVLVFIRKRSLLGESLSHAAYPGVVLAVIVSAFFLPGDEEVLSFSILIGAFFSAFLGLIAIHFLEKKFKVKSDAALCFVLASFFGVGITIASRVQAIHPREYKQIQVYLFGQAATMTDIHIVIYAILSLVIVAILFLFFKELKAIHFDPLYAKSLGLKTKSIEALVYVLIVLAVIVGIRSVGVVLMSAMLIAPAVAARQYTHKLKVMFCLAAFFGIVSGFLGNYFSFEFSTIFSVYFPNHYISVPTGPMIVIAAVLLCLLSLFFAPKQGVIVRAIRIYAFRMRCLEENILKAMWRVGEDKTIPLSYLTRIDRSYKFIVKRLLSKLIKKGLVLDAGRREYLLSEKGKLRASHIVRLHRLWEVYLASYLGIGKEHVHRSAEEMEHIITPELEEELTHLLQDPKEDPHQQPIPRIFLGNKTC